MFKLINNSIFGKSCENKRNRTMIELVTKENRALKVVQQPRFDDFQVISDDLVALRKHPVTVRLDKPIYLSLIHI